MDRPIKSYQGDGPYVFVSYAHSDADRVYRDIEFLHHNGVQVWYDEGITPGSRWTDDIARAIENSGVFVAFVSPSFVASENCVNELEFAVSRRRRVLTVYLEPTGLPPGIELSVSGRQAIRRHDRSEDAFRADLTTGVRGLMEGGDGVQERQPGAVPKRSRAWMAVAAVLILGLVGLWATSRTDAPEGDLAAPRRTAVAVLPLVNRTGEADLDYLAEGIADELIIRLGRWSELPVIARATAFAEAPDGDAGDIGARLDVRYVVAGSLLGSDERLRFRVQLIDTVSGIQVWSRDIDRPSGDLLELQQELSDALVSEINPALLQIESARAVRTDPTNQDAWTAAMRGWWHVNTETKEGLDEARLWFEQATELDPSWGWPHSAMALTYFRAILNGWAADPRAAVGALIKEANAAVSLDAGDAFAHHALGHAYAMQGRVDEALGSLARGVELGPQNAMANSCYGMQLAASNRGGEALDYVSHAMTISPNDPWQHRFALVAARAHFSLAEYPESETWAVRSGQLRPNMGAFLHSVAAPALHGQLERAQQRVTSRREAGGRIPPLGGIRAGFSRQTDEDYLDRLIDGLRRAGLPEG